MGQQKPKRPVLDYTSQTDEQNLENSEEASRKRAVAQYNESTFDKTPMRVRFVLLILNLIVIFGLRRVSSPTSWFLWLGYLACLLVAYIVYVLRQI